MKYQGYLNQVLKFESKKRILFEGNFSQFDVEMIKFGKSIFGKNESRWALINFPSGIFSSLSQISKSIHLDHLRTLCKDKTPQLLYSLMIKQIKADINPKEWYNDSKPFRIFFQSGKNEKPLLLFFENEEQVIILF